MEVDCKYDIKGFSEDLGLPVEDIANLYSEFLDEISLEILELRKLIVEKDWEAVRKIIHNMKGLSVNFRIIDIYRESVKIHNALKINSFDGVEPMLDNLIALHKDAVKEVHKYFVHKGFEPYLFSNS